MVLSNLQQEVKLAQEQYGDRLRVVSLAVPGTIRDNHLMQAPTLDWFEWTSRPSLPARASHCSPATTRRSVGWQRLALVLPLELVRRCTSSSR